MRFFRLLALTLASVAAAPAAERPNILLMVIVLLWRPQGLYPVGKA